MFLEKLKKLRKWLKRGKPLKLWPMRLWLAEGRLREALNKEGIGTSSIRHLGLGRSSEQRLGARFKITFPAPSSKEEEGKFQEKIKKIDEILKEIAKDSDLMPVVIRRKFQGQGFHLFVGFKHKKYTLLISHCRELIAEDESFQYLEPAECKSMKDASEEQKAQHILWLLEEVEMKVMTSDEAGRKIGFAWCLLETLGIISRSEAEELIREDKNKDYV